MSKPPRLLGSILGLTLLFSSSCQSFTPLPSTTPTPQASPSAFPQATPTAGGETILTIWAPPEILGDGEITDFVQAHPQIQVNLVPKKPYGVGGLLERLLTTNAVVPDNLPEMVLIDSSQLAALREEGIVQAIDAQDFLGIGEDLYPFALSATMIGGQSYAVPALTSLEHLAYDPRAISSPPEDWEGLLARGKTIALPLSGQEGGVSDAFLLQYLALGGQVLDESGQPTLSQATLARTLQFFLELDSEGLLSDHALEMDPAAAWGKLSAGEEAIAEVKSLDYLAGSRDAGFAGIPTGLGSPATIARVWAFAILTNDADEQEAATVFISWLLEPERLGEWATVGNWIPSHRSLLEVAIDEGSYRDFLAIQLDTAYARPPIAPKIAEIMQQALVDVLSGASDPQQAAERAVENLETG